MDLWRTGRALLTLVGDTRVDYLSASFAYYAFMSILPLIIIVFLLLSSLVGEAMARQVVEQVTVLTPTGKELVMGALLSAAGRLELSVVSFLVLLWSGQKVFRILGYAFTRIYTVATERTVTEPPLVERVLDAAVVFVGMVLAFTLLVVVNVPSGPFAPSFPVVGFLNRLELLAGLALAFFPLYYVLPPIPLRLREALPGTLVAAGGFIVLEFAFDLYAQSFSQLSVYGVFGAFLLFVLWLYASGFILLVGACINAVLAR